MQAVLSAIILVLYQMNESISGAYEEMINATIIVYFIPFLYMYAAALKLSVRSDRKTSEAVLVPGGKPGILIMGILGFAVTAVSIVLAVIPSKDVINKPLFEIKVAGSTIAAVIIGLMLYYRGAQERKTAPLP